MSSYDGTRINWVNRRIKTDDTVIGQVVYAPNGRCGPRSQTDYELVIIHSGECQLNLDGKPHTLKVDHVCLLLPSHQEEYAFSPLHDTHHSWCTIAPHAMPTHLKLKMRDLPFSVPGSETFNHLLSCSFYLEGTRNENRDNVINIIGQALFAEFIHVAAKLGEHESIEICVSRATSYMEHHFSEENCLEQAQIYADVSTNTLIKKFREYTNLTPSRYLWKLRTERGIAMLNETGLMIAEIADQCGFKNQFHFTRKVTECQGMSPRQLRNKAWGK